ncbi:FkbM family methyltransferase [Mesorhizobium hawassense]|uniref:FkbM family methyltransferase n=1 Tax=Mesorhizobium hawassense TaxID=1209954 RepID=A0A330HYJ2_9HYPH|nr:FkbM family methyltransferase [Mesorhizobium hawassense]RAZ92868.1 FkbM family methyltransferase [Mesorhizobium hawassense]
MPITCYAQNFEDVILWRALRHVEHGFYIDIGAQDPVVDSVSLAFYERGWRGVHVEPSAIYAEKLRAARPDEDVIQSAIALETGEIGFFEIADTGMSTGNEEIARQHQNNGFKVSPISVSSQPLSAILSLHADRDIHWMKIDVEGMEHQVIKSWLPSAARPWIVVVESTKPNSQEQNHETWEQELLDLGYEFVYFDGLNRFYLNLSHPELKSQFDVGPNYFDWFAASTTSWLSRNINAEMSALRQELADESKNKAVAQELLADQERLRAVLELRLAEEQNARASLTAQAEKTKAALEARIGEEERARLALESQLGAIYTSTSWRITEPIRILARAARRLAH